MLLAFIIKLIKKSRIELFFYFFITLQYRLVSATIVVRVLGSSAIFFIVQSYKGLVSLAKNDSALSFLGYSLNSFLKELRQVLNSYRSQLSRYYTLLVAIIIVGFLNKASRTSIFIKSLKQSQSYLQTSYSSSSQTSIYYYYLNQYSLSIYS